MVATSMLALGAVAAAEPLLYGQYNFEQYVAEFDKSYEPESVDLRREVFESNLAFIREQNERFLSNRSSWYASVNDFADLSPVEFSARLKGLARGSAMPVTEVALQASSNPTSVDWREQGVATPARDQGGCGSCWAFAASAVLESHHAMSQGKLLSLAPQALVDCVKNPKDCGGTGGCDGATAELAFELAMSKGVPLESDYAYSAKAKSCKSYSAAVRAEGYSQVTSNDAAAVETAVATKGPLAVSVAGGMMQLYGGGIFDRCSNDPIIPSMSGELNHAVVLMGYGVENGEGYWLVRNSWGESYGENGYIRITRKNDDKTFQNEHPEKGIACKPYPATQTVGGECGILFDAVYPTGVSLVSVSV